MVCFSCHSQIPDTAKVCGYCGTRVGGPPDQPGTDNVEGHASPSAASRATSHTQDAASASVPPENEDPQPAEVAVGGSIAGAPIASESTVITDDELPAARSTVEIRHRPAPSVAATDPEQSPAAIATGTPMPQSPPAAVRKDPDLVPPASAQAVAEPPSPEPIGGRGWRSWVGLVGAILLLTGPWFHWLGGGSFDRSRIIDTPLECCEPSIGVGYTVTGNDVSVLDLFDAGQLIVALGLLAVLGFAIRRIRFLTPLAGLVVAAIIGLWIYRGFYDDPFATFVAFPDHVAIGAVVAATGCLLAVVAPWRAGRKRESS